MGIHRNDDLPCLRYSPKFLYNATVDVGSCLHVENEPMRCSIRAIYQRERIRIHRDDL
jgi:hypothetical protein